MKTQYFFSCVTSLLLSTKVVMACGCDPQFEMGTRPVPQEIILEMVEQEQAQTDETCSDEESTEHALTLNDWKDSWNKEQQNSPYKIAAFETKLNIIRISDGSEWKIAPDDLKKMDGWQVDQSIVLEVENTSWSNLVHSGKHYIYSMVNLAKNVRVRVLPFKGPSIDGPYFRVEALQKTSREVSLNDGSTWIILSADAPLFKEWALNDPVILGSVKKGLFTGSFDSILINVESNHYVRVKRI